TGLKTGSYFVTVTSGGCSSTGSTVVSDFGIMTPAPSASPAGICPGNAVMLSVNSNLRFSNNASMNIPDGNGTGVFSPVVVTGFSPGSISSGTLISVTFTINHTFTNDLEV